MTTYLARSVVKDITNSVLPQQSDLKLLFLKIYGEVTEVEFSVPARYKRCLSLS